MYINLFTRQYKDANEKDDFVHQNNHITQTWWVKNFEILAILNVHNNFDGLTKLFLDHQDKISYLKEHFLSCLDFQNKKFRLSWLFLSCISFLEFKNLEFLEIFWFFK